MKPLYLAFSAFGPYLKRQEINFEQLSQNGIFLISGETGAGKTAIMDAIVYALYGKSSTGTRGDISAMRCQLAPSDYPTELEYIFEMRGKKYKFTRMIKYGRKNFTVSQNAMHFDGEVFVPFFENPRIADIENKAAELLGLSYEQFRQVAMLPQGQFEKLLLAKSDEKEKILVSLFGAGAYAKAADILAEKLNSQRRELDFHKARADGLLHSAGASTVLELEALLAEKRSQSKALTHAAHAESAAHAEVKKAHEKAAVCAERFAALDDAKRKIDEYKLKSNEIVQLEFKLAAAQRAKSVRAEYDEVSRSYSDYSKREKTQKFAKNAAEEANIAHDMAAKQFEKAKEKQTLCDENKSRIAALREKYRAYEELSEAKAALDIAEKQEKTALEAFNAQKFEAQNTMQIYEKAQESAALAQREYQSMLTAYIAGVSGVLAQKLQSNSPCPVCGSTHHPNPAKQMTGVTDAQLETARINAEKKAESSKTAAKGSQSAAQALSNGQKSLAEAQLSTARLTARHDELLRLREKNIHSLEELKSAVNKLSVFVKEYENEIAQKQTLLNNAIHLLNTKQAEEKLHEKEFEKAKEMFEMAKQKFYTALSENNFADTKEYTSSLMSDEQINQATEIIHEHKAGLDSAQKSAEKLLQGLSDKERPDIAAENARLQASENKMMELSQNAALAMRDLAQLEKAYEKVKKDFKKLEEAEKQNAENLVFVKQLRGDSGVSLQRYVLGVMLNLVTQQANMLLQRVHGGRYSLYRTLEASGKARKAGLELEVLDRYSGEKRSVSTLSGGEKFLTALSLSIGLSAVVQSQSGGVALGAMFIDEGFGSLDPASISDALSVLAAVNSTAGTVGIISHVESMKENIPSKIIVEKTNEGSELTINC